MISFHLNSCLAVGSFILSVCSIVVRKTPISVSPDYRFSKKEFLTDYERRFFAQLCQEVPGHHVFPRVSMGALLEPDYLPRDPRRAAARSVIPQHADFIVCNAALGVEFIVELVDLSNSPLQEWPVQRVDVSAGYKVIHIKNALSFDFTEVQSLIPGKIRKSVGPDADYPPKGWYASYLFQRPGAQQHKFLRTSED